MTTRATYRAGLFVALVAVPAGATFSQQALNDPLSAIDWLSDSIVTPVSLPQSRPALSTDVAASALFPPVSTTSLDSVSPDAIGTMSADEAGLPADLWGASPAAAIAERLSAEPLDMLPSMQTLMRSILLARLDPPFDASRDVSLFLARVDRLLQLGMLSEAEALLEAAPTDNPAIFRRVFDVALLTGEETAACGEMRRAPGFSPTYTARIFCLARMGDWRAAALTLESANAVGILTPEQDMLMARFLDPELFEGEPAPAAPLRPTPLEYRLFEAIGEPSATSALPIAFAHADLRPTSGWKARIAAAERLAETGALPADALFGLYREARPSASGGVWERARAVQTLDAALDDGDPEAIAAALPVAWAEMVAARLEHPFASVYGARLNRVALTGAARERAFRIGLVSPDFADIAAAHRPENAEERFLVSVARGLPGTPPRSTPLFQAIQRGMSETDAPERYREMIDGDRRGEALLAAIQQVSDGAFGDVAQVADALAVFRLLGLDQAARAAALELLVLERRG